MPRKRNSESLGSTGEVLLDKLDEVHLRSLEDLDGLLVSVLRRGWVFDPQLDLDVLLLELDHEPDPTDLSSLESLRIEVRCRGRGRSLPPGRRPVLAICCRRSLLLLGSRNSL